MTLPDPPFILGQAAFKDGVFIGANPYEKPDTKDGIIEGDDYPGDWANWRAGWKTAKARAKHDEKLRRKET